MNSENRRLEFEESILALKKLYDSGSESSLIDGLEQTYRRLQDVSSDSEIFKSNSFEGLIDTAIDKQLEQRLSDLLTKSDLTKHATEVESEINKSKLSFDDQVDQLNKENVALRNKQGEHAEALKILHSKIEAEKIKGLDQNAVLQEEMDVAKARYEKKIDELDAQFSKHQGHYDSYVEKTNEMEADRNGREQDHSRNIRESWFFHTFRKKTMNSNGSTDDIQGVTDASKGSASNSDVDDKLAKEKSNIRKDLIE